jgi:hypothetical protein
MTFMLTVVFFIVTLSVVVLSVIMLKVVAPVALFADYSILILVGVYRYEQIIIKIKSIN